MGDKTKTMPEGLVGIDMTVKETGKDLVFPPYDANTLQSSTQESSALEKIVEKQRPVSDILMEDAKNVGTDIWEGSKYIAYKGPVDALKFNLFMVDPGRYPQKILSTTFYNSAAGSALLGMNTDGRVIDYFMGGLAGFFYTMILTLGCIGVHTYINHIKNKRKLPHSPSKDT